MDNGEKDMDKNQVYVFNNSGVPRRDEKVEQSNSNAEKKNANAKDKLEEISYMPNKRYNAQQARQFMLKHEMQQQKEQERLIQE
mmetsp:Transcript_15907/g.24551  ORF Transcript_15907/g.24551 Transcript_15907/m.24551 type:complete len:84 (+) Transcript_15907:8018-8269(+)